MSVPVDQAVARLLQARGGMPVGWREVLPADRAAAFAVQDATLARIGPAAGWKVGAKSPGALPTCAPLPVVGLLSSGTRLVGAPWRMRGVELEVAVRFARDLPCESTPSPADLQRAIDAVLPAIEVVETRLADWRESDALAQLADLQTHGALVLGEPSTLAAAQLDLRRIEAYLAFDGQPVASARGANPAGDVWRLLSWLAVHCTERGQPLRAGDVVTTGSCTGMLFAPEGAHVLGALDGLGRVELNF